ncbi:glycosyltransferase [Polynucleobacter sp. AM-26B4]|uniref:glycosyltransferase family 2 protein n=1 Tax=Polynucleobacter sp. AM-26B4 TaxID=2689103 RepID=UPI001C0C3EF6|nr:glycosyltransferase [Polynucleobacter sp. AM-26B4]MBU3585127.1 glycosyltransferase [Polynucleobacter sp. AM-26B4]
MSEKAPLVSVVVTTFNRCEMLAQTINSILEQTFSDFELIVVDNMSEDGTCEYINGIKDGRIRFFRNHNHGVIAKNRNYGIRKAGGIYIAFCDDDDLWVKNKLDVQVAMMKNNQDYVMCYSQAESFLDHKTIKKTMIRRTVKKSHFISLLQGNFIPNSSVLIKRDIFQQLGYLNESSELREDYEMWLRVTRNFLIVGTKQVLIKYRIHGSNSAGSRVAETGRAIRTLRSLIHPLRIPVYLYLPNLLIQYLKLLFYKIMAVHRSVWG